MKIAYSQICINPDFPVKQHGFIQQVKPIFSFHDDLHARILALQDENKYIISISCDILGMKIHVQNEIEKLVQETTDKEVHVIISGTHTHFGADDEDIRYQGLFTNRILRAIEALQFIESDNLAISYQCVPFTGVGTSRISNHTANVLLQLFTIYDNDAPIIRLMVHNCHPTVLSGHCPYFTSEYPGYVLSQLKHHHEEQFFTFYQGAAGDVSTRFTRSSQDYNAVKTLGDNLVNKIEELMNNECEKFSLNQINFEQVILPCEHELNPIDMNTLPEDLTERELVTIGFGQILREELNKHPERLQAYCSLSKISFGQFNLIFSPNELFSYYISAIDTNKSALCCYSNGYAEYVTGIDDHFITYEAFTDTLTKESKQKLFDILHHLGA